MAIEHIILSNAAISQMICSKVAAGQLRKISPDLYTSNMKDTPEAIIRRNIWQVVALYCPGAIITDRTGIENRRASDGSIFVVHDRLADVELPGLRIRPRRGAPPTNADRQFFGALFMACPGRLFLENLLTFPAEAGAPRTLSRPELETHLEKILSLRGGVALNRISQEARELAPSLGLDDQMKELDGIIGALLGTSPDNAIKSPSALARIHGRPYDTSLMGSLDALRAALVSHGPAIRRQPDLDASGLANLAFFDAYFSNFIEGTEFEVDEAVDIVFNGALPINRLADAHDLLGAYRLTASQAEMTSVPKSADEFLNMLRRRHAVMMAGRPEMRPGSFKHIRNRVGDHYFVEPELVAGTLEKGYEMYCSLNGAFERAAFMKYLVAEVHPYLDGNGRLARITMNAELAAAGEQRILIPIVFRNDYLSSLRALTINGLTDPYIRMLDFAQRYSRSIPWNSFGQAQHVLEATHALLRPEKAENNGIRLKMPTQAQLQEAEDIYPLSGGEPERRKRNRG